MNIYKKISWCLLILIIFIAKNYAQEQNENPYTIINKYFNAIGSIEKVKAEKTSYFDAKVLFGGMEGTLKQWNEIPGKIREEFEIKIIKQTSGDNGAENWVVDTNGKIKINTDEATEKRRKISAKLEEFEFMDPKSEVFKVTYEGITEVGTEQCYAVKIINNINSDVIVDYYSTANYYKIKTSNFADNKENVTSYSDYRNVFGILKPFKIENVNITSGQKTVILVNEYKLNINIDKSLFNPPAEDVKDYVFTNGLSAENIPCDYYGDHVFLTININGNNVVWFLDSGADVNVIDLGYATQMGLKPEGEMKAQGVDKVVDVAFVKLPGFNLPGLQFKEQNVMVLDILPMFKQWGYKAVGILGYDFMSRFVVKVDYANKLVSLYDPATFKYSGNGTLVDAPLRGETFTLPILINDKYKGTWSVDIGAGGCSFHYPYAKENGFLELKGTTKLSGGAGGYNEAKSVKLNKLSIAGFDINKPVIDMPLNESKGAFASTDLVGNLGNNIFEQFVIYFDYKNQQMIFEKGENFGKSQNNDKSGLQIYLNNNTAAVLFVSPNTPAEKVGLLKEDIITKINDITIDEKTDLYDLKEILKGKTGDKVIIEILRNNEPIKFEIVLEELL
ncbi:MAG: aspartyl protease family protein [bacterium]